MLFDASWVEGTPSLLPPPNLPLKRNPHQPKGTTKRKLHGQVLQRAQQEAGNENHGVGIGQRIKDQQSGTSGIVAGNDPVLGLLEHVNIQLPTAEDENVDQSHESH